MTLRALLFDLDGTLLPLDLDEFLKGYFRALVPSVAHVVDTATIVSQITEATEEMIRNEDANHTNEQVFRMAFFGKSGLSEETVWPAFEAFYETAFASLRALTQPTSIAREICQTAYRKGYRLVLATNPIFPQTAVRQRMEWAGIGDIPFHLVTTMEDMHFCKPNPKYYMEIAERLDVSPEECMMIGNDVQEDGVAGKIGMQTFLVRDCLIDRGVGHMEFTREGSLADVLRFVESLPTMIAE
ncbi:hydrolase [Alicyclobacillus contaminans]|uniref:HAD family hydrolase n=1 Tax=Alicyclobacillus contaminans TaxID=392016 RepID=UPI00040F6BE1|nr:HAD family hydrolase [Alicyclobacillus contaminans]GMA50206.1 hydrolase [Alicyclobacillus contaminans]